MTQTQKTLLPKKISMLTLKLKSFAFMKIFMHDSQTPTKYNKVRHYDLELQGATAISSWLKAKLQQVYLRSFDRLKSIKPKLIQFQSAKHIMHPKSQPYISSLNSPSNSPSKQMESRTRCQTDREMYVKDKQSQQRNAMRKNYKSEFGQQTFLSQNSQSSNLQSLLQKVKQVNSQSKIDKQNEQQKANNYELYEDSYGGSRVLSSGTGMTGWYKKPQVLNKNITFREHNKAGNGTSQQVERHLSTYIGYNPTQRYQKEIQTPNSQVQKIISRLDLQEDCVMDKNNLLSLKKWHKNQKRSVIMNKINELEHSLMAEYSRPQECFYEDYGEGFYPINSYDHTFGDECNLKVMEMPGNYSQSCLQGKLRQAPRSVYEGKMRKY